MQTQQQKPVQPSAPKKQRLTVGEIVICVFDLFLGILGSSLTLNFLRSVGSTWRDILLGGVLGAAALGALLAALLVALRQRRLAFFAQMLSVVAMSAMTLSTLWLVVRSHGTWTSLVGLVAGPALILLMLGGFAWFLKRMDKNE